MISEIKKCTTIFGHNKLMCGYYKERVPDMTSSNEALSWVSLFSVTRLTDSNLIVGWPQEECNMYQHLEDSYVGQWRID